MNKKKLLISGLLTLSLALSAVLVLPFRQELMTLVLPSALVGLSNSQREDAKLPLLEISPKLQKAAQLKANDMAKRGYFSHYTPEGNPPWYWLDQVEYDYRSAGENLAVNFTESTDVDKAWMNSPKHRENILNKKYTEVGIATAKGLYKGEEATFVVQFFGKPTSTTN